MTAFKDYDFYARTEQGFIPKTAFEALHLSVTRITLRLKKDGIFIREADTDKAELSRVLWDISWESENFVKYICRKEFDISLNVKQIKQMLKAVKKKESTAFFISKNEPNKLCITIQPTSSTATARSENISIIIRHEEHVEDVGLPEYFEDDGKFYKVYDLPVVIPANDLQKIKKNFSSAKVIDVIIQKNNYISFLVGDKNISCTELKLGELLKNPDIDDDDEEPAENNSDYPYIYSKSFNMSLFGPLIKLPGLTKQMQFYAPKIKNYPLKVSMKDTSTLGTITIYIKDIDAITEFEGIHSRERI